MKQVAVIGAGSWGTALAVVLARGAHPVRLWTFEPELAEDINQKRCNTLFMPEFTIPEGVTAATSLAQCLDGAELVVMVVPSQHCRGVYQAMLPFLKPDVCIVSATKGIEDHTLMRMSEVVREIVSPCFEPKLAVISGPSFAKDVVRGDPTAIVAASPDKAIAELVQHEFSGPSLRLYTSSDMAGVELGGSVKNVIAIAAGICTGLGLGANTIAALLTRGLAEMTRLALACGGKRETLAGLAGMGDLVLTCTGALSRNRTVGMQIGQGKKLPEIISGMRMVAEGVMTAHATLELACRHQVEMPITAQMDLVLHHDKNPREAVRELMERRLRDE